MSKPHGKHARVKSGKDERFVFSPRVDNDAPSGSKAVVSSSAETEMLPLTQVEAGNDADVTEFLAPVPADDSDAAAEVTQLIPPVAEGQDEGSADETVMIAPISTDEDEGEAANSKDSSSSDQAEQADDATVMLPPVKTGESHDDADAVSQAESASDDADEGQVGTGSHDEGSPESDDEPLVAAGAAIDATDKAASETTAQQDVYAGPKHGSKASAYPAAGSAAQMGGYGSEDEDGTTPQAYAPAVLDEKAAYVAAFGEVPLKKRRGGLKVLGITLGIIVAALLLVYVVGGIVFMGRFLPSTVIAGEDISFKTDEQVKETLNDIAKDYQLSLFGGGFSYRLTGGDIGLSVDADSIVKAMHKDLDAWKWPLLLLESSHDETKQMSVSFNRELYEPALRAEVDKYNETGRDPVNATIVFDDASQKFVVQPEQAGTKLNVDAVLASTAEAINELSSKVSIGEDHLVKPTVYSTDEKLKQAAELASGMVSANLTLYMGGQPVGEVSGSQLSDFVTLDENYEVTFREEDMNEWVNELARSFDTVGTERIYTRPDGKQIAVSGGVYGWEVDSEELKNTILEGVRSGAVMEVSVPCLETAEIYQGPNLPDWGTRFVDVDISEQYVRFYQDGEIIWEAPCITGSPDGKHDTGRGVWRVNGRESPSKLIGYEDGKKIYETSVTYWMPFEGNGIGFHDATWQPGFGGSMYANGYGSHGCVNLSYGDAESLYGIIQPGDCVIVHD